MKGIYTDLDTLIDVRLGLLYLINRDLAIKIVETGEYFTRLKDNLGEMSYDIFYSFYNKRNKLILYLSLFTNILERFIRHDCYEKVTHISNGNGGFIKIYVNTYPYVLTNEEKDNLKLILLKVLYGGEVEFIYKNPKEVDPEWVYDHVKSMYMYNGLHWMNYHSSIGNLARNPLPNVMLMVPTLIETSIPSHLITKQYLLGIEEETKKFIMLTFADTIYFCAKNIKRTNKNKV